MEIARAVSILGAEKGRYVIKLIQNLHGQKQAGRVWHEHLKARLKAMGFKQSFVDECVSYYKQSIFIVYVGDTILLRPSEPELEENILLLQTQLPCHPN